jgi:hypothetical protein
MPTKQMTPTVLEGELLPGCAVAAVLERIEQGTEWRAFLDRALHGSLITWAFSTSHNSAVVGHTKSLAALEKHIATCARTSYRLSAPLPVSPQPLEISGRSSGKIKKQTCSADQFASITIQAEPVPNSRTIKLTIPRSSDIPPELHASELPEAILDGVCHALLAQDPARPIVGCHVSVINGQWHDVDSHAGVFKRATCMAMSDILSGQPIAR